MVYPPVTASMFVMMPGLMTLPEYVISLYEPTATVSPTVFEAFWIPIVAELRVAPMLRYWYTIRPSG